LSFKLDAVGVRRSGVALGIGLAVGITVGSRVILGKGVGGAGVGIGWVVGQSLGCKGDEAAAVGWASPAPQPVKAMVKSQGMSKT
jgi:hypothetical protein